VLKRHGAGRPAAVGVLVATALAAAAVSTAVEVPLDRATMARAVKLARWPATDADRAAFHSRYLVDVSDQPIAPIRIDRIEVTTEFRRLVLLAEYHAQLNDLWGRPGTRDAEEALRRWRGAVWITAHGTYRNTANVSPPPAELAVGLGEPAQRARASNSWFDEGGNCSGDPSGCQIFGATIEAEFDAAPLAHAVRPVVVDWHGATLARITIDFGSLE
jgi:hypothetical protein